MNIQEFTQAKNKNKGVQRVGRGDGSGRGKTSGRGTKGQKARSGGNVHPRFEGGQTPLMKIIPKKKGFKRPNKPNVLIINLSNLEKYGEKGKLTIEMLKTKGYIPAYQVIKILGVGELTSAWEIQANAFSKSAKEQIEKAGGKVEIVK
ncbi:MAG: 50S ribosomal protein L15 [Patescibacteria group bacterium]|nr:50S ribosomal protein L15 [Patescibacteria group bacterium]